MPSGDQGDRRRQVAAVRNKTTGVWSSIDPTKTQVLVTNVELKAMNAAHLNAIFFEINT